MSNKTPKEQAEELIGRYLWIAYSLDKFHAKKCALICVDELIQDNYNNENIVNGGLNSEYWKEVKQEIETYEK